MPSKKPCRHSCRCRKNPSRDADQTDVTEGDSSTEPQAEEDEPEVENITPQAENAPSARDSSSGLTMGTTEEAVPECGSKAAGAENSIPAGEMGGAA